MLLRNSISTTRKLFKKTIQSFKSFFSTDHYQKLPKTPPPRSSSSTLGIDNMINAQTNFITNKKEMDNFYNAFNDRWDDEKGNKDQPKRRNKKMVMSPSLSASSTKQERDDHAYASKRCGIEDRMNSKETSTATREGRSWLVAQKLKDLQKMDVTNVEHALDIEEVLHYYSRLTCPAYLDMVDKFFMEMYAEFIGPPPVTPRSNVRSRPRLRSVRS